MAPTTSPRSRITARVPLLGWVVALSAVVIGAVVALSVLNDTLAAVGAVAAAIAGTATIAVVVHDELAEDDPPAETRGLDAPRAAALLGVVAVAAVAAAVYGKSTDARDTSTWPASEATAVRTVRDFVVVAAVDHDGEEACGFLTAVEQAHVGGPAGGDCRQVVDDGSVPGPDGASSADAVGELPAAATLDGGRATVRLGTGAGAVTYMLHRAAGSSAFDAPQTAWRIAAGATPLVRPHAA